MAVDKKQITYYDMHIMIFDLKSIRTSLGFSQVELASLSGVSLPTIQNIEAKKANPTIDIIEKLCIALGIVLDFIPAPIDYNIASILGVPLSSTLRSNTRNIPTLDLLKSEVIKWTHAYQNETFNERDFYAFTSFLMAVKDHYPTLYKNEIQAESLDRAISKIRNDGKAIKLRSIALSYLGKYL